MKMKNRFTFLVISIIIIIAYIVRVVHINSDNISPDIITYKLGDEVPIEDDYFNSSDEKMNGYTIKVLDTEIISMEKFQTEHSSFISDLQAENIFIVKVLVRNVDNTLESNAGINFGHYLIQEGSYINMLNRDAYPFVNKFNSLSFSLRCDSEMEFILPFNIDSQYIDVEKLKSGEPTLVVSLYPHKKVIELND